MSLSRRNFLSLSAASTAGSLFFTPLQVLAERNALGQPASASRYGFLEPDPNGILDLPVGFQYKILSRTGEPMTDRSRVPAAPDGMAAFRDAEQNIVLIRNHELSPGDFPQVVGENRYDARCSGGTTTLVLNRDLQLLKQYASLTGTTRNCAGGATPWNSWISCEEDVSIPGIANVSQRHGYNFEVPVSAQGPVQPLPLKAMGRFNHEAIAVDPRTGIVYQTEDRLDGLFYRFIPHQPERLAQGGRLEALKLKKRAQAITQQGFTVGESHPVEWVTIEDPDPVTDAVRQAGFENGAAQFSRGEGIIYGDQSLYFTCTSGGALGLGQIWRYQPDLEDLTAGTLTLFAESTDERVLDYPDNITVSPFGDFFICEDGRGEQFLRGLDQNGNLYPFARNALNNSEFTGICFSADPLTLFVNIQRPGVTLAIWGDFERSLL